MKKKLGLCLLKVLLAFNLESQNPSGSIYSISVLPPLFQNYSNLFCWLDTLNLGTDTSILKLDTSCYVWQLGFNQKPEIGIPGEDYGIETGLDSAYPIESNCSFLLHFPSNPLSYGQTLLFFEHRYFTDSLSDGGILEFSNNGTIWKNVVGNFWANFYNFPSIDNQSGLYQVDSLPQIDTSGYSFTGTNTYWTWSGLQLVWEMMLKTEVNETPVVNELEDENQYYFRFRFKSDSISENKPGWMIRNLVVGYSDVGGKIETYTNPKFQIFPNPANETIQLSNESKIQSLTLYTVHGQNITLQPDSENRISVKNLTPGIYWIYAQTSQGNFHSKFIKQ